MHLRKLWYGAMTVLLAWSVTTQAQTKEAGKTGGKAKPAAAMIVEAGSEKWGDVPAAALVGTPAVELGGTLRMAVIQGDPTKPGRTYTMRLSCTDGMKVAPHWHPTTENVTVIKGAAAVGMGSKWDDAALQEVATGGFFTAGAQMRHFLQCKGDTIVQVHGVGPFVVNFVGPDDNGPSKP